MDFGHTYGMLILLVLLKKKIKTHLSAPFQPPERRDMDVINFTVCSKALQFSCFTMNTVLMGKVVPPPVYT
jgi:hypothetical protein